MQSLPFRVAPVTVVVVRNRGGCGDFAHLVAEFEPPPPGSATAILSAATDNEPPPDSRAPPAEGLLHGPGGGLDLGQPP